MHTFLSSIIPCVSLCRGSDEPRLDVSRSATEALESLATTCGLSAKGSQALAQWTCWLSYAETQAQDPHILDVPGWSAILPIDTAHAQEHLYQVLLRAGESRQTALKTAMKCYPEREFHFMASPLPKPLQSVPGGMAAFTTKDLPSRAVPYESLPAWARENALYATDLTGKSLAGLTALAGLDLRFLNLYCADLGGLDLRHCDFLHADMRGTQIAYANVDRARMDDSLRTRVHGPQARSYPPVGPMNARHGSAGQGKVNLFHDREILNILTVERTQRIDDVNIGYLEDGRSVIQQQARKACSAGVSAMLIADHGGDIDTLALRYRGAADERQVVLDLEEATDFTPVTSRPQTVKALADRLAKHGPAIVGIGGEIGNHFVIVDAIDLKAHIAELRDPHHGWSIQVPLVAFTSRWAPGGEDAIVQLSAPKAQAAPPPALWA